MKRTCKKTCSFKPFWRLPCTKRSVFYWLALSFSSVAVTGLFSPYQAAKQKFVVCVPAAGSLGASRITADFLQTHVLRVSPYFKNEYISLNNKVVAFRPDKTIFCKKGFPKQRTVVSAFFAFFFMRRQWLTRSWVQLRLWVFFIRNTYVSLSSLSTSSWLCPRVFHYAHHIIHLRLLF